MENSAPTLHWKEAFWTFKPKSGYLIWKIGNFGRIFHQYAMKTFFYSIFCLFSFYSTLGAKIAPFGTLGHHAPKLNLGQNFYQIAANFQMRLVTTAKASPYAVLYSLTAGNSSPDYSTALIAAALK